MPSGRQRLLLPPSEEEQLDQARALLASAQAQIALLEEEDPRKAKEHFKKALEYYRNLEKPEGIAESLLGAFTACDLLLRVAAIRCKDLREDIEAS